MKFKKDIILLVILFLVAAAFRLIWLGSVPGAITGDELTYIIPIKAIALSGHNFSGNWSIFQSLIFSYPTTFPQAELPYFLLYPAIAFLPLGLFTTRITYVIISIATVFAIYFLTEKLLGRRAGIVAGFLAAINPWQVFMGRTTYETVPATFFFVTAIYFLIKEKGNRIFLALPLFIFAFYSYIGTKIIFLPIVISASIFAYFENKKKFGGQYLILNAICVLLVLFFVFRISGGTNRVGEIASPSNPEISRQVDVARKNSISPNSLTNIFENKFTIYFKLLATKTVESFSPSYLFVEGDTFTSLYGHGMFYVIDALFLVIGIGFLFAKKIKAAIFLFSLILISTLPHVLHYVTTEIFTPHLALFMAFLIIPIAYGISELIGSFKNKLIMYSIILVYIVSAANFAFIYFFQFPLQGSFDFPSRTLSHYVMLASNDSEKVNVFVKNPEDFYRKYIYYTNSFSGTNFEEIKNSVNSNKYVLGKVNFFNCGDIAKSYNSNITTIYQSELCGAFDTKNPYLKIARLTDGGQIYRIYNDTLCSSYGLNNYPQNLKISDFSIENLSSQKFCETFVTR